MLFMNSQTRFLNSCKSKRVDRPPVWLMRQAGRCLPEYRALRERHDFLEMLTREELIAEVSLQPWRRFQMDAVIVFADILLLPMVLGMELQFLEGQGPKFPHLISGEKDLGALKKFNAAADIPFLTAALKKIKRETKDEAALIGFAGSPWTVASYVTQDFEELREKNPALLKKILGRLTKETIPYLKAQVEAGADVLQIFDSWGGILSPSEYAEWSAPYIREIAAALKATGVPIIIYVKESAALLEEMIATACDVISVGWETPLAKAKQIAGGKVAIQGNFNPHILMQATPEEIRLAAKNMIREMEDYPGYIANLGHGVLPKTPVENIEAFTNTIKLTADS